MFFKMILSYSIPFIFHSSIENYRSITKILYYGLMSLEISSCFSNYPQLDTVTDQTQKLIDIWVENMNTGFNFSSRVT